MQARTNFFTAIQGGIQKLLVATVDLTSYTDLILAYGAAYQSWLEAASADFDQMVITTDDAWSPAHRSCTIGY